MLSLNLFYSFMNTKLEKHFFCTTCLLFISDDNLKHVAQVIESLFYSFLGTKVHKHLNLFYSFMNTKLKNTSFS